jgi:DNA-binding TFAR19-related protein (PDSD5 family)
VRRVKYSLSIFKLNLDSCVVNPMSDRELEAIKQRKLRELQKRMVLGEQKKEQVDGYKILNKIFKGRAWEVFYTAQAQFPHAMVKIEHLLVRLCSEGKTTQMTGEQLYALLREIGLRVRLNTTIKVARYGKTKLLSEKFKQSVK